MKLQSKTSLLIISFFSFFLLIFLFRIFFVLHFFNLEKSVIKALIFGVRFDLRLTSFLIIPIFVCSFFGYIFLRRFTIIYSSIIFFLLIFFYYFDFGFFSYLGERIDVSSLRFLDDFKESRKMIWESYPIIWIVISMITIYAIYKYLYIKIISKINILPEKFFSGKAKFLNIFIPLVIIPLLIYGNIGAYPLRWSEAFFSKNKSINQLSLNPILSFIESFKFRKSSYDIKETKKYFHTICDYLEIEKNDSLNFGRYTNNDKKQKYNVVVVMLESMGADAMGYFGNPANVTPVLDNLFRNGISFENFIVPRVGTAPSVFNSITSLPDIMNYKTASRNPNATNQRIIFNEFKGYSKFYIIGGSANWANIRATFQSNIDSLKIYEEGSYDNENRVDVWGISDYDLLKESNKILAKEYDTGKKFIAYIQTASNHKPYTVPDKQNSYVRLEKDENTKTLLGNSGFSSLEQLNAFRYLDFNIGEFLETARKEKYFDSTIFVFFGDHSVNIQNFSFMKRNEGLLGFDKHHVPLIIYAPKILTPKIISTPSHLSDMLPTVANLAGISFNNYTLGRDALKNHKNNIGFFYSSSNGKIFLELLTEKYLFKTSLDDNEKILIDLNDPSQKNIQNTLSEECNKLDSLARGFYESTRYLYYNNKRS